jgi:hypothetical protein
MRFQSHTHATLKKRRHQQFRGYPIATIAFYGPDDKRASKVAVAIVNSKGAGPSALERWFSDDGDVRADPSIGAQILRFVEDHGAKSVIMTDRLVGCPHEEGIDYPKGQTCPHCPFWTLRDQWTSETAQ